MRRGRGRAHMPHRFEWGSTIVPEHWAGIMTYALTGGQWIEVGWTHKKDRRQRRTKPRGQWKKPARLELERDKSCIATQPSIFLIDKKARLITAAQCSCVACGPRYCQVIREANREARLLWCQQMLLDGETFDDEVFPDETIINLDTHEDIGDYDRLIGIAKGRFPTSSIVMSSVLPRLDFNDRRIVLNQHLAEVCDDRDVVYYKNFETINPAMLARDHLHLHKAMKACLVNNCLTGCMPILNVASRYKVLPCPEGVVACSSQRSGVVGYLL
ncbi:hypothetical protein Bbelb_378580 [Branchiostoma belcheri]|nr:hypothetical protein Bbelb_378580 [Branchiostoma belcheri]